MVDKESEVTKVEYCKKELKYIGHRIQNTLSDKIEKEPETKVSPP